MGAVCKLTINDRQIEAKEGMTILEAARSVDIYIPTLCYHPLLKPLGGCRLCVVEIIDGNRSIMGTSCTYPVAEGLDVKTDSAAIIEARKVLVEFLLARTPKARLIQRLARQYGVENTRLEVKDAGELCILCGLCARMCDEVVGASAINFIKRGVNREITFNPEISSDCCVGCGVCTTVCPTECLEIEKPYGVISAIDMGRKAAISMDKYLGGDGNIEEELLAFESPNPWIGKEQGFADRPRMLECYLLDGSTNKEVLEEANRCLQCDLRLQITPPVMPPERWIEFIAENVESVPETEGVCQLFDKDKNIVYIKGGMNLRQELEAMSKSYEKAKYFIWEEEPMYTKRESELLQQFMQRFGKMPEGNAGIDEDLY
jgi:ferredoxin